MDDLSTSIALKRPRVQIPPGPLSLLSFHLGANVQIYFLLSFKNIVILFLTKVDGQMYREDRDKCPENPWILIQYLHYAQTAYKKWPPALIVWGSEVSAVNSRAMFTTHSRVMFSSDDRVGDYHFSGTFRLLLSVTPLFFWRFAGYFHLE
jgi:hypothetical protein